MSERIYKGRIKILSDFNSSDLQDFGNVVELIKDTEPYHMQNMNDIVYLRNYWKGVQPVLDKEKAVRPEINNKLVVNHAQRITRTVVGYFLGNPIQYIQSNETARKQIDELNALVSYEDKPSTDKEIAENQSITGTGYRIIVNDDSDDVPFEEKSLDPENTYVVYNNNVLQKPIAGITYINLVANNKELLGKKYFVYTDFGVYVINAVGQTINQASEYEFYPYNIGGVPIIEYPNNEARIGDWELFMSIMNAINDTQSNRLDDIEQVVQSLLVFTNVEIDSDTYQEMREAGVVMLNSKGQEKSKVDIIKNALDQAGIGDYLDKLERLLDTLVGVPSRDGNSGGGADTGQAVEMRDGWADLELLVKNKELTFKKSEKQSLKIILSILRNMGIIDIDLRNVDIKFSRNKNHNLLVKAQSYQVLNATQTLAPADVLSMVDLVSDENEYAQRGEEYWKNKLETIKQDNGGLNAEPVEEGEE